MRKYRWVDFAAHYQKGFRNHIVAIEEVPESIRQYRSFECFSTYFFYTDEIFAYMTAHAKEGHPSIAGFDGKVWAPFLPIDVDSKNLDQALDATRLMAHTLIEEWKVPKEACHFYFSGAKGFHILLDSRLFGRMAPSRHLHLIFSTIRTEFLHQFPHFDHSLIDLTIKDRVRLLRLPNTVNVKSNLYKIPVSYEALRSESIAAIQSQAASSQTSPYTDETGLISKVRVEAHPAMTRMFARVRRLIRRYTKKPFVYHFVPKFGEDPAQFLCPGFAKIWETHVDLGQRNNCAFRLLSEFRLNGLSEEKSRELIHQWNDRGAVGLPEEELERTIRSAFGRSFPYRYSCRDPIVQRFCPFGDTRKCEAWQRERRAQAKKDK